MYFHGLWTEIVRTIELSNLGRSYARFGCNHIRMILVVLRLKLLQKVLQANASSFVGKRAWCFLVFFNRVIQILTRSEPNHNYHAITVNDKPRLKLNRTKRRLENRNFSFLFSTNSYFDELEGSLFCLVEGMFSGSRFTVSTYQASQLYVVIYVIQSSNCHRP